MAAGAPLIPGSDEWHVSVKRGRAFSSWEYPSCEWGQSEQATGYNHVVEAVDAWLLLRRRLQAFPVKVAEGGVHGFIAEAHMVWYNPSPGTDKLIDAHADLVPEEANVTKYNFERFFNERAATVNSQTRESSKRVVETSDMDNASERCPSSSEKMKNSTQDAATVGNHTKCPSLCTPPLRERRSVRFRHLRVETRRTAAQLEATPVVKADLSTQVHDHDDGIQGTGTAIVRDAFQHPNVINLPEWPEHSTSRSLEDDAGFDDVLYLMRRRRRMPV